MSAPSQPDSTSETSRDIMILKEDHTGKNIKINIQNIYTYFCRMDKDSGAPPV